jgi:hypothetical protein
MGTGFRLLTIQHNESYSYDMARLSPAGTRGSWITLCIAQVLIGQVFSGCSQCVFLNAAPLLSGLWFGENERVLATTIAMEANTLGSAARTHARA